MIDLVQVASPRLICLGLSAYDLTWIVDSLPSSGGKTRALDIHEGGGGMAANASVAATKLGADVKFWGRAGQDPWGFAMREGLQKLGVDVTQFRLFEGSRSSVSGVIVDRFGERTIVNFRGLRLPEDPSWLPLAEVEFSHAVLADSRWPEGALALFQAAKYYRIPSVLDGDVTEARIFDGLLPFVDYAVFSESGLKDYAAQSCEIEKKLQFARSKGCGVAAVTLGERGVLWVDDEGVHHLPAFPVKAVDTTGAGDVFHGAFAFAIGARAPLQKAFQLASVVAALKCMHSGGRNGVPNLSTALSALQNFEEKNE